MNELFSQGGKGSTGILTNKQAVARHFGVKQSEVVYFSVGAVLNGYKVIYDKKLQRAYSLPAGIGSGVTSVSLSPSGVLVHSAGSVDLGALAVTREEYVTLPGSFITGVTVNSKNDFQFVLRHIAYTCRDIIYGIEKDDNVKLQIETSLQAIRNTKSIIEIVPRPWNNNDKRYWNQFDISLNHLNTHFVYAIDQYYINRYINPEPKYFYDSKDPCYAYVLGQDKNGIYNIKLYFPNRKKGDVRFITNSNHIEGVLNLELNNYDYIVITKSSKDRLAIENHFIQFNPLRGVSTDRMSIGVINIPSETYRLKQKEYDYLHNKLNDKGCIISLMDNDMTGYREAIWLRDNYNIIPFVIPKEYDVKDFAELKKEYSGEIIDKLIIDVYNYIEENYKDNGEKDKLAWDTEESSALPY